MSQFETLINRAKSEEFPQRILFLFANAVNMLEEKQSNYHSGTIEAVMCVDKAPTELSTFNKLVSEADQHTKKWNFIFVSTLAGKDNKEPTDQEVDLALHNMSNSFAKGDDLSQYVIWDRKEQAILIS
jgi:hypothetical protein